MQEPGLFSVQQQAGLSFLFLLLNVAVLLTILRLNRRQPRPKSVPPDRPTEPEASTVRVLAPGEILGWEFEYARSTASEAMHDRHTMMNFYLLVVGIVVSGVVALLASDRNLPLESATALLWPLSGAGWLYFLKIIRLREAWHESVLCMNQVKDFYIRHSDHFSQQQMAAAFRWKSNTVPEKDKLWTIFFYSAMLIAFLDSGTYVAGGILLNTRAVLTSPWVVTGLLSLLGLCFFGFHVWLYTAFLRPRN